MADPRRTLFASAFVAFLLLGPLGYLYPGPVQTQSTPPWPEWRTTDFFEGRWTAALGRHLEESAPLTAGSRGLYNEAAWLAGNEEHARAVWGRAGWLFGKASLKSPAKDPVGPSRRAVLRRLAAWARDHDVLLLAAPVPDKWRIHPEHLREGTGPTQSARDRYPTLLRELADARIETLDLAEALQAWRRGTPTEPLYSPRDTHWNTVGTVVAADAIAARLGDLGWLTGQAPVAMAAEPFATRTTEPDLVGTLGFRVDGPLARALGEERALAGVHLLDEAGNRSNLESPDPTAPIAAAGDSFSTRLDEPLARATGRRVDATGCIGAKGPLHGLAITLGAIESARIAPRLVVWCFIERSTTDPFWERPPAPLDADR